MARKTLKRVLYVSALLMVLLFAFAYPNLYGLKLALFPPPIHDVQKRVENGTIFEGYRPFEDPSIRKVCFEWSMDAIERGKALGVETYDHWAIVEYRKESYDVKFVQSGIIDVDPPLTIETFCTEEPASIVVRKLLGWRLEQE